MHVQVLHPKPLHQAGLTGVFKSRRADSGPSDEGIQYEKTTGEFKVT